MVELWRNSLCFVVVLIKGNGHGYCVSIESEMMFVMLVLLVLRPVRWCY